MHTRVLCELNPTLRLPIVPTDKLRHRREGPLIKIEALNPAGGWGAVGTVEHANWPVLPPEQEDTISITCIRPGPNTIPLRIEWRVAQEDESFW